MMKRFNILVAGVGGQGILSASRLLAQAAVNAGERVIVGDTFGASQREGSVASAVRLGEDVYGSIIAPDSADMLIAFEPYEALRRLQALRDGGVVLANTTPILPVRAALEGGYPPIGDVWSALEKKSGHLVRINASAAAGELAARHKSPYDVTNVVILGAACTLPGFPIEEADLVATMEQRFDERSLRMNKDAFARGKRLVLERSAA